MCNVLFYALDSIHTLLCGNAGPPEVYALDAVSHVFWLCCTLPLRLAGMHLNRGTLPGHVDTLADSTFCKTLYGTSLVIGGFAINALSLVTILVAVTLHSSFGQMRRRLRSIAK